jgi:hypothetical protein
MLSSKNDIGDAHKGSSELKIFSIFNLKIFAFILKSYYI